MQDLNAIARASRDREEFRIRYWKIEPVFISRMQGIHTVRERLLERRTE